MSVFDIKDPNVPWWTVVEADPDDEIPFIAQVAGHQGDKAGAMVLVMAQCGHYDRFELAPGETLVKHGVAVGCLFCSNNLCNDCPHIYPGVTAVDVYGNPVQPRPGHTHINDEMEGGDEDAT